MKRQLVQLSQFSQVLAHRWVPFTDLKFAAPPLILLWLPGKKLMGKVAIFFPFPKYANGRLGATFWSQITFSVVRRGPKWSNLPQFHKGDPVGSSRNEKIPTKIGGKLNMIHVTFWSFSVETYLVSARYDSYYEVGGNKISVKKYQKWF